jgi:hypothetical protein
LASSVIGEGKPADMAGCHALATGDHSHLAGRELDTCSRIEFAEIW